MSLAIPENPPAFVTLLYDRRKDLEDFDNSKAGVKGLVDSGIKKVPRIFIRPPEDIATEDEEEPDVGFEIPVIDLGEVDGLGRSYVVSQVLSAASEVGFFQVVNHGIGMELLEQMLESDRSFHEIVGPLYKTKRGVN